MTGSAVARLFRPPRYREQLSRAQWDQGSRVRAFMLVLAIMVDIGLYLGLRGDASIDQRVLTRFAVINISVLAVDALVCVAALRLAALRKMRVVAVAAVLEGLTVLVWIQATGTLSSYFVLVGALLIVGYRLYYSYAVATAVAVAMLLVHAALITLELAGVIPPEPLFLGAPSRVYDVSGYQVLSVVSIAWVYVLVYVATNGHINKLRDKDRALAEVRKEVAEIAEGARHGRLTGTVIAEEYALGELIGRGGMGEIYVARRISDDQTVALKVLHPHLLDKDTMLERFKREARAAERIPSGHTARILDVGCDDEQNLHYLVMEYLRGEDMGNLLRRRGPLGLEELVPILRQVAQALDAAHGAGVIHRDLKPANIFLAEGRDVRILDFGISKLLGKGEETLTSADALLGTVGYMAPEQALPTVGPIGPATDRFALAAVAYRALTGRLPFEGKEIVEALHALLHADAIPPSRFRPQLGTEVDLIMAVGMAKDPADRYSSASAMVDDLQAAIRETPPGEGDATLTNEIVRPV